MKTFLKRRIDHAKKNWWSYGLGGVIAATALAWLTNEACIYSKNKIHELRDHYRQSEMNAADIQQIRNEISALNDRMRRLSETNRLRGQQINALTETNKNLRYWIRTLQR